MNGKLLSVIIVSYKNLEIVIDCLDSIRQFNDLGDALETIIVDNSPETGIFDHVRAHYPEVTIVRNANRGFGQGNNVGAGIAVGRYLLFLNPDTILIEPVFRFAADRFERCADLGLFGVKLVDAARRDNLSFYWIDRHSFWHAQLIKICNRLNIYLDGRMYIAGADIFIRRELFLACGQFDENIFMYYEEPDLTKRVRALKARTAFFGNRKIVHLEGQASGSNEAALRRRLDSARYYCRKYSLSFTGQLKREKRYERFKLLVFNLLRRGGAAGCRDNIRIYDEYLRQAGVQ